MQNDELVSREQLHLRDKMLQEEEDAEAARLQTDGSQSSVESYSLSPAAAAGTEARRNTTVDNSQDCFPSSGSLPGGTRSGDFLGHTSTLSSFASSNSRRGIRFKCCTQCGTQANSNRSKACKMCGCVEFAAPSKLRRQVAAADSADARRESHAATGKRARSAHATGATTLTSSSSGLSSAVLSPGAACPFCVAGSGKVVGHRGAHKTRPSTTRTVSKCGPHVLCAIQLLLGILQTLNSSSL